MNVTATSIAGTAGPVLSGAALGTTGTANASATAITNSQGYARANGIGTGSSGTSIADAQTTGLATIALARGTGTSTVDGNGQSEARALLFQTAPTFGNTSGQHAAAYAVGQPSSVDVTNAWTASGNVKTAFANAPANVQGLGIVSVSDPSGATSTPHTFSTAVEFTENSAVLNSSAGVLAGMLTSPLVGSGLGAGDSLRFRIVRQGATLIDQTFTTNAAAQAYLQNTVFELGKATNVLGGGNPAVKFLFDLTSSHASQGISANFVAGNVAGIQTGTWINSAGGSWALPGNWINTALPNGPGTSAIFATAISTSQIVNLDENTMTGNLTFSNATASYTIAQGAGGGALTLDNAGGAAGITVTAGNHAISAPIVLASPGVAIGVSPSNTLTLSGGISGSGGITTNGLGTVLLSAGNSYSSGTSLAGGTVSISSDNNLGAIPASPATNLTFNNNSELFASASLTASANRQVSLPGGARMDAATGATLTIGGAISGTGGITKGANISTLSLLGSNSFSGGITIPAGTVQIGNGGNAATAGTGSITDNAALVFNHSDTVTQNASISGSGSLTQTGSGTLVLGVSNSFAGGTTISGGVLSIIFDQNLGAVPGPPTTNITLDGGELLATVALTTANNRLVSLGAGGGTFDASGGGAFLMIGGKISGTGTFTKGTNINTVILLGSNSYSGITNILNGILQIGSGGSGATPGSGPIVNSSVLAFEHSDSLTVNNLISGVGSLIQSGTGTLILGASNSYTGVTSINGGVLSISADNNLGTAPVSLATNITLGGGELLATASHTLTSTRRINITAGGGGGVGTIDASSGKSLTIAGPITGGTLDKGVNISTLILLGVNSYTATNIFGGTLQIGNGGSGATIGSGVIADAGALIFNHNDTVTVGSAISGTGSLTQTGNGTLILNGTNSYSGGTSVTGGTLSTSTVNGVGSGSVIFNAGSFLFQTGSGFDLSARTVIIQGGGAGIDTHGNNITFNTALGGVGQFTKLGTGTLTLAQSATYSGGTNVQGGALVTAANFTNGMLTVGASGFAQVTSRATSNTPAGATFVPAISITTPGALDLSNNALIIDYTGASPLVPVVAPLVKTGFNSGSWTGAGITSSAAAAVAISVNIHKTALGFGDASTLGIGTFAGHSLDGSDTIVAYAPVGDANLDGQVNTVDFNMLAGHYNQATVLWTSGDFNYDGKVNALDFNGVATNFGATFTGPPLGSLVPEPTVFILAPMASLWPRRRRRKSAKCGRLPKRFPM